MRCASPSELTDRPDTLARGDVEQYPRTEPNGQTASWVRTVAVVTPTLWALAMGMSCRVFLGHRWVYTSRSG
jgi:hypothetical protein